MKIKHLKSAAMAFALVAAAATGGPAAAQSVSAVAKLLTPEAINAGEPVKISCEVENAGVAELAVPPHFFSIGASDGAGLFFVVKDEAGSPQRSACPPKIPPALGSAVPFRPGEYHGFRSFDLSQCFVFEEGKTYSISAEYVSRPNTPGAWNGSAMSNPVKVTVKEDTAKKNARAASELVSEWLNNYDYHASGAAKKSVLSLGTSAVPALADALRAESRLLAAGDIIELLGYLPCRESVDALVLFVVTGGGQRFNSGIGGEFSGASILVDAAVVSLEKISGERFSRDKGDLAEQWYSWHEQNRNTFKSALGDR
ncbi:MAG TPA: hypothetical protein PLK80_02660 [bacterium]|nr:MAG: hypothetical protein BWY28_01100 [bacterium ADurb.Bin236]HOY64406.1 hypothetical protein [bacterium]HPI75607.1 hypothetical protein [bacterium]HPN93989.1 hypothetical protein [bacterium]